MELTNLELSGKTRKEKDLLGEREIPIEHYFGIQTQRALRISVSVAPNSTITLNLL